MTTWLADHLYTPYGPVSLVIAIEIIVWLVSLWWRYGRG